MEAEIPRIEAYPAPIIDNPAAGTLSSLDESESGKAMTETASQGGTPSQGGKEAGIVRALEEDIIFGRLPPGTRLVEDALLARFPVTRHVIRQALVELERLGIVTRERNKGAAVRTLTPGEVRQIYEMRELLQRQAALTIPLPAPPDLIDRLR